MKNKHRFRKGQKVFIDFSELGEEENYTGPAIFVRYLTDDNVSGWTYVQQIEPHCIVKVDEDDCGSCFPVRCVKRK